jgi:uncharacterized OsmC-like protein
MKTGKAIFQASSVCPSSTLTKVTVRDFEILIDEPPSNHGMDEAALPIEYMLASLAGYSNVIIHKIAVKNDIHFTNLEIDIVGTCDTRGIHGKANIEVQFKGIRLSISANTQISETDVELVKKQLSWRCPVKMVMVFQT